VRKVSIAQKGSLTSCHRRGRIRKTASEPTQRLSRSSRYSRTADQVVYTPELHPYFHRNPSILLCNEQNAPTKGQLDTTHQPKHLHSRKSHMLYLPLPRETLRSSIPSSRRVISYSIVSIQTTSPPGTPAFVPSTRSTYPSIS